MGIHSLVKWKRLQWSALLLSLALLCAQTIAQQHIHAQDMPSDTCVVCVHGDAPAIDASIAVCAPEPSTTEQLESTDQRPACQASSVPYRTRAPPRT